MTSSIMSPNFQPPTTPIRGAKYFPPSLLCLCILLTGCIERPVQALRLGTNRWVGYETLYLARDLGYLDASEVKLVELPSATDVAHAFLNHTLEIAALTLDEAITLLQSETDIRIILVFDFSVGGDVLMVKPSLRSLADLKDKRIAVENTAVGAILLDGALSAAGLTPADITIVPLTVDGHLYAYLNDEVDGVVTFEPVKNQLKSAGSRKLYDSSMIPGRIVDVLVTRQPTIEQRADDLKQLLAAYFKGLRYLRNHREAAAERIAPRLGVNAAELLPRYAEIRIPDLPENRRLLGNGSAGLQPQIEALVDIMYRKGLIYRPPDGNSLLDASLIPTTDEDL